ncbi:MAG: hypothetical protein O7A65_04475 [Proteobacteria bacterium]|nr:hypothetical protein [Pseudomonadota bacterium]
MRFFSFSFLGFFAVVTSAIATDDVIYSVQWSPKVEIENLGEIDELLNAPFYPEERLRLYSYDWIEQGGKHELVVVDTQIAKNCTSLIEWTEMGYRMNRDFRSTVLHAALDVQDELLHYCYGLLLLKEARPARISYVRDFVFDEDTAEYLPAMVRLDVGCRELRLALRGNREGVPLSLAYKYFWEAEPYHIVPADYDYDPESYRIRIDVQSDDRIVLWSEFQGEESEYKYHLEVYGRADFNGDGFDDLLLSLEKRNPSYASSKLALLILTRKQPGDVLRVVDVYWPVRSEIFISCRTQRSKFETEGEY